MPAPDPSRRSEPARQAILAAARALTSEVGSRRVTVEAIAARAGVGKQTIYRWWPSREAVVLDAVLQGAEGDVALPDTGDLAADLTTVLRAVVAELDDPATDRFQRAVAAEVQDDLVLAGQVVERLLRPQLDAVVARLEAARAAGGLAVDVDAEVAAGQLLGPVFHRWLLRIGPLGPAYADAVVRQVLTGLAPRPGGVATVTG